MNFEKQNPQLLFSELEVDRLKVAFDMHAEGDENVTYVENLDDLLKTLFIVSQTTTKNQSSEAVVPFQT